MSSRETRSKKNAGAQQHPPPTTPNPTPLPPPSDSGVAVSSRTGAAGPTPAGVIPDSPASPSLTAATVVPTHTPTHRTTPPASLGGSTRCSSASAARLRRLRAEYEVSTEVAEMERRHQEAEDRRVRALAAKRIELARAEELVELEEGSLRDDDSVRSVTEGKAPPSAPPVATAKQIATSLRGEATAAATRAQPQAPMAFASDSFEVNGCAPIQAAAPAYAAPSRRVPYAGYPPPRAASPARAADAAARPGPTDGYPPPRAASPAHAAAAAARRGPAVGYPPPRAASPVYYDPHATAAASIDPVAALAAELKKLADRPAQPLHPRHRDLPRFSGERSEWLAFLASYRETNAAYAYTAAENMTRLRTALSGGARERVEAYLLSSGCDPERVLQDLQRIYGRPRDLIDATKRKVLQTKALQDDRPDLLDEYACRIRNLTYLMRHYEQNTDEPHFIENILAHLTPMQRVRYGDYAERYEHSGQSQLELISDYLCLEADKAMKFNYAKTLDARQPRAAPSAAPAARAPPARPPPRTDTTRAPHVNAAAASASPSSEKLCRLCEKPHTLPNCKLFVEKDGNERWDVVRAASLCFKCLRGRHRWTSCKAKSCGEGGCKRPHHRLLHRDQREKETEDKTETPPRSDDDDDAAEATSSCFAAGAARRAYLKIAPVVLRGPRGTFETYALLDDGSTTTLLESFAADKVGARGRQAPLRLHGIGGALTDTNSSRRVNLEVRGRHDDSWHALVGARTVNKLGLGTQTVDRNVLSGCKHLKDIEQELQYADAQPTLLIGQDNWNLLVSRSTRIGAKNQPIATQTDLGWVLHGFKPARTSSCFTLHVREPNRDDEIERLVRDGFALESLGVAPRAPRVPADERAMSILRETTKQLDTGRYEVGLLWKTDNVVMPPSERQALTRLRSIERKMKSDTDFARQYKEKMQALFDSGYAELCPSAPPGRTEWYLPHFAVKNPNKPGKIRIVHDAAACVGGTSLNENLLAGPDMLQPLLGVLLRFREGAVAVTGDIREMFMRVQIREEDRDAQRFLWRDDAEQVPKKFRMTSLIFGAASSPCTALHVKNENAKRHAPNDHIKQVIVRDHYMDDAIHSCMDENEAATTVRDVTTVHAAGGFEIRGWASNRPSALRYVETGQRGTGAVDLTAHEAAYEKTLGLIWQPEQDELAFNLSLHRVPTDVAAGATRPTKRQMLSLVMSIFDPLGLLSPVTTRAKVLLQQVWRSGISWDQKIEDNEFVEWTAWMRHLAALRELRLRRHYGGDLGEAAELHVFCDASSTAYAAVAYWRYAPSDGPAHTTLIASKSRVAPLKPTSIPRLELQATILGVRLAEHVLKEHRTQASRVIFWSDSRTALCWIKSEANKFKPFVAHRVAEIQETTKSNQWRWVPTKENPADLATRNPPEQFTQNHWWFTGPKYLSEREENWPTNDITTLPTSDDAETKKIFSTIKIHTCEALPNVERFSSWKKLIRATARVLQFAAIIQAVVPRDDVRGATTAAALLNKKKTRKLVGGSARVNIKEKNFKLLERKYIDAAEVLWCKEVQKTLQDTRKNPQMATLAPTADENGVLHVGGRINAARGIDDSVKRPIILHGDHKYTKLLIRHFHEKMNHGNNATVINEIRQKFWVVRLRNTLRGITRNCKWCHVRRDAPRLPPPGDLPGARFNHHARPFTCCGVDYFGPMEVTVGRRREKRWGALFTCLTTRAVHLELAAGLSADSMLLALRRMAARRGTPAVLWSDNGTNFVGANRELTEARLELERLGEAIETMGIEWRFLPPGAPNMAGVWERMVRSVKTALAATLRERAPREEVLATLICEAEHIVNSRPLTHISADPDDEEALTPNHFLMGTSSGAPVPVRTTDGDLVGRATWRTAQRLADHFWSRWLREYLPTLVPRGRATRQERDLAPEDVVLVVDPSLPRNVWPRGRVERVFPGPDGRVRVVDVRTAAGLLRRPVRRLVLLPTREPAPQE